MYGRAAQADRTCPWPPRAPSHDVVFPLWVPLQHGVEALGRKPHLALEKRVVRRGVDLADAPTLRECRPDQRVVGALDHERIGATDKGDVERAVNLGG